MKYLTALVQYTVTILSRPIFYFFFRFRVEGVENVPKDTAVIFAVNHTSKLDPFILCAALPLGSRHLPLYFVSRERRFYTYTRTERILYGGWLFRLLGAYPAYSGNKDYEYSLREHVALLEEGRSVCIYPEGGLARNGHERKSRGGVSYLASKTNLPVVPVYMGGLDNLTWRDFWLRKKRVAVVFGEPLQFKGNPILEVFKAFAKSVVEYIHTHKGTFYVKSRNNF